MSGASAEDFKKWRDCAAAREAFKRWNPERENHYADQCFTYSDELYRRTKG